MTPTFQITADGHDVTASIRNRFVSLKWHDAAGIDSDTLHLVIDDRIDLNGKYIEMPRKGVTLDLALGYGDQLTSVGKFIVDESNPSGYPEQLSIKAKATDMRASLKVKKSRGFDQISIADLVATIANQHQLQARVATSLASEVIARIDQTDESDLHLLTRLARDRGAVTKPAYGYLLFVPKGEAKSASGSVLPKVTLDKSDLSRWDVTLADREKYNQVTAKWYDKATAKEHQLHAGSGEPIFKISRRHSDADTAQKAADARYSQLRSGTALMSCETAGRADLVAEAELTLTSMRPDIPVTWIIESADHSVDKNSGWKVRLNMKMKV